MTTYHRLYGNSLEVVTGDVHLHNKDESTLNPPVGEAYLYLKSNVLNVRKNGPVDIDLESGGSGGTDPLRLSDNTESAPAYSFASNTATGIFLNSSSNLAISASGYTAASISSNTLYIKVNQALCTNADRAVSQFHHSGVLVSNPSAAFTTVATVSISNGETCMLITEGISRTDTSLDVEIIKTTRSISKSAGTIVEHPYIDDAISSDAWQFDTSVPGVYTLQLRASNLYSKRFTYLVRVFQINNSNISIAAV
jgi:hypothetical protein